METIINNLHVVGLKYFVRPEDMEHFDNTVQLDEYKDLDMALIKKSSFAAIKNEEEANIDFSCMNDLEKERYKYMADRLNELDDDVYINLKG